MEIFTKKSVKKAAGILVFLTACIKSVCGADSKNDPLKNFKIDFYSGSTFQNFEHKSDTWGAKFISPFSQFRFYTNNKNYNTGYEIFTGNFIKSVPLTIKVGNLSPGGSLSKLNNPLLSTSISPFTSAGTSASNITASLPGYSAFSKPLSAFGQISVFPRALSLSGSSRQRGFYIKKVAANLWSSSENSEPAISLLTDFCLSRNSSLTCASTFGFFDYESKCSSSWFSDQNFYHAGKHLCTLNQAAYTYGKFSTLISVASYEQPDANFTHIYRTENKVRIANFTLGSSVLYNPYQNVMTSSQKIIDPCVQLKNSLQYQFRGGKHLPVFYKAGINSYVNFNLEKKEHQAKLSAGFQGTSALMSLSVYTTANFDFTNSNQQIQSFDFDSAALTIKNTLYFQKITTGVTASFTVNPDKNYQNLTTTEKFSASASFNKNPKFTADTSLSFTQKNNTLKQSGAASLCAVWTKKHLSVCGKITVKADKNAN